MAHIPNSENNRKFDTKMFWKDEFGNNTLEVEVETTLLSALFNLTCVLNNDS